MNRSRNFRVQYALILKYRDRVISYLEHSAAAGSVKPRVSRAELIRTYLETGSYTRTAEALGISKSAVDHVVRRGARWITKVEGLWDKEPTGTLRLPGEDA